LRDGEVDHGFPRRTFERDADALGFWTLRGAGVNRTGLPFAPSLAGARYTIVCGRATNALQASTDVEYLILLHVTTSALERSESIAFLDQIYRTFRLDASGPRRYSSKGRDVESFAERRATFASLLV
jgi:hypothetical protein